EPAEMLLLDRDPFGLVQLQDLGHVPRKDLVVPLLDDHVSILGILLCMALGDRFWPAFFDLMGGAIEKKPAITENRRKLLAAADGRVLEVGAGTGFNLPHYPEGVADLTITDGMDGMLRRATRRAGKLGRTIVATRAPVESLPF